MYAIFYFEFLLHASSLVTAIVVVLKINVYDKINPVAKLCISMIYSSVFLSDISYSYAVYIKCLRNQLVFTYSDVINEEPTPIQNAIFCHEMGTWVYVWGVLLTATERLLNGHYNFNLRISSYLCCLAPLIITVIFGTSYFCTTLLLSADHQRKADCMIIGSQIFGVSALVYTLYLNQKNYKNGIGCQSLEERYQSAYVYKFNRSLLNSLIGEVLFRAIGFSFIVAITLGVTEYPTFGWLSFAYHNTIPVGSIFCPWFIVLRHFNFKQLCCGSDNRVASVSDLNGKTLALRETTDEHFASLDKIWNAKFNK